MRQLRLTCFGKPNWGNRACALLLLCASTAIASPAQTFTSLHSFGGADGRDPFAGLVQGANGNLYGTTVLGGANTYGAVFTITPSGTLTTLYSFGGKDGGNPDAALVQATNGNFYGTTQVGGTNNQGTVFKIAPGGALTTLYSFCPLSGCPDGLYSWALIQATDGNFYGTTYEGGANNGGTVFKITPGGTLTTLYSFCSQSGCPDGLYPQAGLVQAANGIFYGTTSVGGANGQGTVFEITSGGALTTLYSFCSQTGCTDGYQPYAELIQAADGNFYGTTSLGGINGHGTVFKITSGGTLTTLYDFCSQNGCPDGDGPLTSLVQATDGDFYGTTSAGGASGAYGTVFKITPGGTLTTLHSFDSTDGETPSALIQDTNGEFYGTTSGGGTNGYGTVFSLSVGLHPFVETLPASGKVGAPVKILGTKLKRATSVNFNGTPAVFKAVSNSLITTSVPKGASTGFVTVRTPSGTLKSNKRFRVKR